jgi:hypothetical protein
VSLLLLAACAEPSFSFRGYTEHSDCRGVLNAELAGGTRFFDASDIELPRGAGIVTRMTGTLFALPVDIYVSCYDNGVVAAIDYITDASDFQTSNASFAALSREFDSLFGAPALEETADSRSRIYRCGNPSTLVLREARHGDMDYETSVLVVPQTTEC